MKCVSRDVEKCRRREAADAVANDRGEEGQAVVGKAVGSNIDGHLVQVVGKARAMDLMWYDMIRLTRETSAGEES